MEFDTGSATNMNYELELKELSQYKFPNDLILSLNNFKPVHLTRYIVKHPNSTHIIVKDLKQRGVKLCDLLRIVANDRTNTNRYIFEVQVNAFIAFCKTMECLFTFEDNPKLKIAILNKLNEYEKRIDEMHADGIQFDEHTLELNLTLFKEFDRFRKEMSSFDLI